MLDDAVETYCLDCTTWEVLNGVGVDGVGVIFPVFYAFSPFFYAFFPFSSLFSASPRGQGQTTAIYCKNAEFRSDGPRLHRPRAKLPEQRIPEVFFSAAELCNGTCAYLSRLQVEKLLSACSSSRNGLKIIYEKSTWRKQPNDDLANIFLWNWMCNHSLITIVADFIAKLMIPDDSPVTNRSKHTNINSHRIAAR